MLEYHITDLEHHEMHFSVPCSVGSWEFSRVGNYEKILRGLHDGQVGNTFFAANESISLYSSEYDFEEAVQSLIDCCLVLSFLNARCVTPSGTPFRSDIRALSLGEDFIRPRAIRGFAKLDTPTMSDLFKDWVPTTQREFRARALRLQLSHWLSGLTCFSLEDLFLSVGIQMDMIKQQEMAVSGNKLSYEEGMKSASSRYNISPLGSDYKRMRNDIVHEGKLVGSNFARKTKADCAAVVADTLNWLDSYMLSVLAI